MLIRFFKENDLIGCGGDTQPIRLQVGTLSQSDYRCMHRGCACNGWCAGVVHTGVECVRVAHTMVAHAGVAYTRVACAGVVHAGVVHTKVACAGVVHTGVASAMVVGTLSQSVEPIRNWQGNFLSSYTHYS